MSDDEIRFGISEASGSYESQSQELNNCASG